MGKSTPKYSGRLNVALSWRGSARLLSLGTEALKEGLGIGSMGRRIGLSPVSGPVLGAEGSSWLPGQLSIARSRSAAITVAGRRGTTTELDLASSAAQCSSTSSLRTPLGHLERAAENAAPRFVYNLTTEAGVYFANGLLVSNCDAMTQALTRLMPSGWKSINRAHGEALDANEKPLTYKETFKKQFWDGHKEEMKAYEESAVGERMGASDPYFGEW